MLWFSGHKFRAISALLLLHNSWFMGCTSKVAKMASIWATLFSLSRKCLEKYWQETSVVSFLPSRNAPAFICFICFFLPFAFKGFFALSPTLISKSFNLKRNKDASLPRNDARLERNSPTFWIQDIILGEERFVAKICYTDFLGSRRCLCC